MDETLQKIYDQKIEELESQKEENLKAAYGELTRLRAKIKKSHLILSKKIHENSLLRDAYERQKKKIGDLEISLKEWKEKYDELHNEWLKLLEKFHSSFKET